LICHFIRSQSVPPPIINRGAATPRARDNVNALIPLSAAFCRWGVVGTGTVGVVMPGVETAVVGVALSGVASGVAVAVIAVVMGSMGTVFIDVGCACGIGGACVGAGAGVGVGAGFGVGVGVGAGVDVGVGAGVDVGVGAGVEVDVGSGVAVSARGTSVCKELELIA
jgi:hypothetical protein